MHDNSAIDTHSSVIEVKRKKAKLISLLQERNRRNKEKLCAITFNRMYQWQLDFIAATKEYHEACLCAANQIGKTFMGVLIDAIHLSGDYPPGWPGHKFDFAPRMWCLGFSMEKTRDLLQAPLFGKYQSGGFEGGLIPKSRILSWESAQGTPNAMRSVYVKHSTGRTAKMQFWSYSQGQHAIMGDVVDHYHVDEEPKDPTIRPQIITRAINGERKKGGRGIYTFTPENGRTELVVGFMEKATKDQFFMMKGWDDAPHMTKEKKERVLATYPKHQRDMRTKGVPMLGQGRIYECDTQELCIDPFPIPDHWNVIGGMDFGWDHPHAMVKIVENPDTSQIIVVNSYKKSRQSGSELWGVTKDWMEGIPVAWPQDGLQHEKGADDAKMQKYHYEKAGFEMLFDKATWSEGGNSVEAGLFLINQLIEQGLFKIFRGQQDLTGEMDQYHRINGKIIKTSDDILDAIRYAIMMLRFAKKYGDIGNKKVIKLKFQSLF